MKCGESEKPRIQDRVHIGVTGEADVPVKLKQCDVQGASAKWKKLLMTPQKDGLALMAE